MSISDIVVDARGVLCPVPVIETKKAMDANPNSVIVTLVDNEVAAIMLRSSVNRRAVLCWCPRMARPLRFA